MLLPVSRRLQRIVGLLFSLLLMFRGLRRWLSHSPAPHHDDFKLELLGACRTVQVLTNMVRNKKPHLVFLMETRMMQNKVDFIRRKLGFDRSFVVDCKGRIGGLLLLWKSEIWLEIQNYSRRHINAVMHNGSNEPVWKITCFYGHPEAAKREEAWNLLRFFFLNGS
jgi:hypothetical protein